MPNINTIFSKIYINLNGAKIRFEEVSSIFGTETE